MPSKEVQWAIILSKCSDVFWIQTVQERMENGRNLWHASKYPSFLSRESNALAKIQNPGESDPIWKRFSDGGACTGLSKLLHTDMHLPFCTNDLGHQDNLNVALHHSVTHSTRLFILDNFGDVSCVTRTVPTVLHTCRFYSFFRGGRGLWQQTSRNKLNQAETSGMGTKCSDKIGNWMKSDNRKFVLVRSGSFWCRASSWIIGTTISRICSSGFVKTRSCRCQCSKTLQTAIGGLNGCITLLHIPVVPHKAVAEVSKIENL